ncbi:type II toxin-antitoxin system RelE/ParE family toxin [Aurantimonas marianensis]|uniref:Type II toxin-antitoxin system RelE/ParE family toxin n=1 Tax=Aurantimonas marianensis TaxID=2920428 RepID=A0A9X2HFP8_9HYPH|nr:type II toxin-antitoxin system RelE/ParE family toxin [Aurantimonas marianensis]MCP3056159.1 type II toxin-antitoxin system RelE/ParE family toxin [Aurantimonas marianensis]
MKLRSIRHKGLGRFIQQNDPKGIRADLVNRVRNILTALIAAEDVNAVQGPPGWRVHQLVGDRFPAWSISVSGNWRITFVIESGEIWNLDLEDYH